MSQIGPQQHQAQGTEPPAFESLGHQDPEQGLLVGAVAARPWCKELPEGDGGGLAFL